MYQSKMVKFISDAYQQTIDGLFNEDVKVLRRVMNTLDEERRNWKIIRKKELLGLRKIDPLLGVEKIHGSIWHVIVVNKVFTA